MGEEGRESGEHKGIHPVASLSSHQLPISQILIGCCQLEAMGPYSCSSGAENSDFERTLPRKRMKVKGERERERARGRERERTDQQIDLEEWGSTAVLQI